jgi:hypothetical protein
MASIDQKDIAVVIALEYDFVRLLRGTISTIFEVDSELADIYQKSLVNSPALERVFALHEDPIDVASTLTGVPVTEHHRKRYDAMLREHQIDNSPPSFEEKVAEQKFLRSLDPKTAVEELMNGLGYVEVEFDSDELRVWALSKRALSEGMREYIIVPTSIFFQDDRRVPISPEVLTELVHFAFFERFSRPACKLILKAIFSRDDRT